MAKLSPRFPSRRSVVLTVALSAFAAVLSSLSHPAALQLDGRRMVSDVPPVTTAKGAYVLAEAAGKRGVTLLASGSEIEIALNARALLATSNIAAAVVSMPSMELFAKQDAAYRTSVLGAGPIVAVEAGIQQCWDRWLKPADRFIGMSSFGASGPIAELYEHFGITAEKVAAAAKAVVG